MQKIAILSDIHANLPALEAVLREVEQCGVDIIVFLGDIVGYGASPAECVDRVRENGGECVMGNHDIAIKRIRMRGRQGMSPGWEKSPYFAGLLHAAESLNFEQVSWLEHLPFTLKIPGAVVAHTNLHEPESFEPIDECPTVAATLQKLTSESSEVGFFGHTHTQEVFPVRAEIQWFDRMRFRITNNQPCLVWVGSVGCPERESGIRPKYDLRASWVLWDPAERIVEFRKTDYNRLQAARDIINAGLPLESARQLLASEEAEFL